MNANLMLFPERTEMEQTQIEPNWKPLSAPSVNTYKI